METKNITEERTPEQREMALYEAAVERFGTEAQIDAAIEEMAELTVALNKYKRFFKFGQGVEEAVLYVVNRERADVGIMLNLLEVIFGDCSEWECERLENMASQYAGR